MLYSTLAKYYDALNTDADYDALADFVRRRLSFYRKHGCSILDLCCGTGELTMRLAGAGYDMIGVDGSADMLSVFSQKTRAQGIKGILILCQDIRELDLFGTVDCVVCTYDALNHVGDMGELEKVLKRVALFLNPDGLFIFDMNTPFKHREVLANHTFKYEGGGAECYVTHELKSDRTVSNFSIIDGNERYNETLTEYFFEEEEVKQLCARHGFYVRSTVDGENFGILKPNSERFMFTAQKTKAVLKR